MPLKLLHFTLCLDYGRSKSILYGIYTDLIKQTLKKKTHKILCAIELSVNHILIIRLNNTR